MLAVKGVEGRPEVVEVPRPSGPGVGVNIVSVGICGSDHHLLAGPWDTVLGHEMAGYTDDGLAVAVEPYAPCHECEACRRGVYEHCALGPAMVLGVGRDGGMADFCLAPKGALTPLPSGVDPADGCLVEPLALAVRGFRRAGVKPGQRVAVVGGGTIGLASAAVAIAAGVEVDVEARYEHQREAAQAIGAGVRDEMSESAAGLADYDIVVEAAGSGPALDRAVALGRRGAVVLGLGSYWDSSTQFDLRALTRKEISLISSRGYGKSGVSRDFDVAASLLAAYPHLARTMITHRYPLASAADAFAVSSDRASGSIKVVLEPAVGSGI